jgi:hypothetical protein
VRPNAIGRLEGGRYAVTKTLDGWGTRIRT